MDWTLAISAASLELVILTSAIGVVWKLTRTEVSLRSEFTAEVAKIRADGVEQVVLIRDAAAREVAALTAKLYQVEIWARDEFVRKGSFDIVVTRLEKSMELLGAKVEASVEKMATRIENMNPHHRE